MVRNDKLSVSAQQNERHKAVLSALLKQEDNRRCADCSSRGPTWASVNLGVFVCLNCSGVHRSLGVHNSKVRSCNLDTWLPEQVAFVSAMGNARAAAYWEAALPPAFRRPPENDMSLLRTFITDKYVSRRYADRQYAEPPSIENYATHPFMARFAEGAAGAQQQQAVAAAPAPASGPLQPPPPAPKPEQPSAPSFDLLSLDDSHTAAAPSAAPPARAASGSHGWDPFQAAAAPAPEPAAGSAPAAAAASWDAFATSVGDAPAPPVAATTPAWDPFANGATQPAPAAAPPPQAFDPFGAQQAPAVSAGQLCANGGPAPAPTDPFALPSGAPPAAAAVPPPGAPGPPASMASAASSGSGGMDGGGGSQPHRQTISHDNIMALFDQPGQHARSASASQFGMGAAPPPAPPPAHFPGVGSAPTLHSLPPQQQPQQQPPQAFPPMQRAQGFAAPQQQQQRQHAAPAFPPFQQPRQPPPAALGGGQDLFGGLGGSPLQASRVPMNSMPQQQAPPPPPQQGLAAFPALL